MPPVKIGQIIAPRTLIIKEYEGLRSKKHYFTEKEIIPIKTEQESNLKEIISKITQGQIDFTLNKGSFELVQNFINEIQKLCGISLKFNKELFNFKMETNVDKTTAIVTLHDTIPVQDNNLIFLKLTTKGFQIPTTSATQTS